MRFVYNDPYTLRGAVEAGEQPIGTRRERDLPIPVDVHREVGVKSNRRKVRSK
jgi:hypothetical protein